ncbi:hypothetical protein [Azospirillum agricola]|uniref:hypothetical protein n=1 Tax=Azospirillum agricola TaxID=1720247 RepID=UPI000A1C7E4C|nr:hypothetical protein [Azospirillum agricola]
MKRPAFASKAPAKSPAYALAVRFVAWLTEAAGGRWGYPVTPWSMEERLLLLLGQPPLLDELVGHPLFAGTMPPEQAARAFLESVIHAPVTLTGGDQVSAAHRLLAEIVRLAPGLASPVAPALTDQPPANATVVSLNPVLRMLILRLRPLLAEHGPGPGLTVGAFALPLPKLISPWDALSVPPGPLAAPATPADAIRLIDVLTDALESKGRHWKELKDAGLVPPHHWFDTTSANQIKALNKFRRTAEEIAEKTGGHTNDTKILEAAWEKVKVPRFASPQEVVRSPLWKHAVRQGWRVGTTSAVDTDAIPIREADTEEDMTPELFDERLARLEKDGILDPLDARLLRGLMSGASLGDLAKDKDVKTRLKERDLTIMEYMKDLVAHVHKAAARCTDNGDDA